VNYHELLEKQPLLQLYATKVPDEIDNRFTVRSFPARSTICCKGDSLSRVGILLKGSVRSLNEFENGFTYVIEKRMPVSFIGAIGCLTKECKTSAKYESIGECEIAFLSTGSFESWLKSDIQFLWAVSTNLANRLHEQVYREAAEHLFLPTIYILFKYILSEAERTAVCPAFPFVLTKPRRLISEELGIPLKTINRTVASLVQDGAISITRGKISLTHGQYESGPAYLSDYSRRSRNGQYLDAAAQSF